MIRIPSKPVDATELDYWQEQLIERGNEALEEVDALIPSVTDEKTVSLLEYHRAQIQSIRLLANRLLLERKAKEEVSSGHTRTVH